MFESMTFTFNGISSQDMGVIMIHPDGGGLYKEPFFPTRQLITQKIPYNDKPYFKRVNVEPLTFSLSIFIKDWEKRNSLRSIARWLFTDYYKPLYFESNPHRIFYATFQGNSELIHNGLKEGHITLNVECNSAYAFSPPKTDILSISGEVTKRFFNEGDLPIYPHFKITKYGAGNISIKNNSNGQEMVIKDLWNDEVVTIDNENKMIISSYEYNNRYLFDHHNDIWIEMDAFSEASFTFKGNFTIEILYEYKYLQEYNTLDFEQRL